MRMHDDDEGNITQFLAIFPPFLAQDHRFFSSSVVLTRFIIMETQFPRLNGAQLSANLGRSVIVIGEVLNNNTPQEVLLRASDGTEIMVRLPMGEFAEGKFVQIMGKVRAFFPYYRVCVPTFFFRLLIIFFFSLYSR